MSGSVDCGEDVLVVPAPEFFPYVDTDEAKRNELRAVMKTAFKKSFALRTPDKNVRRRLSSGWMLPYLVQCEALLWGRWPYWMHLMKGGREAFKEVGAIPKIEFLGHSEPNVKKMLLQCLSEIREGYDTSWGSSEFTYFLEWLLWGMGSGKEPPKEPPYCQGASDRLYQVFQLEAALLYPYDYFGDILAEANFGRASGFFPTPMTITIMSAMMIQDRAKETGKPADGRLETVADPAVGTGRFLLAASNYSLRLYGMDIQPLCVLATQVNLAFYAPWGFRPIPFLDDLVKELRGKEEAAKAT